MTDRRTPMALVVDDEDGARLAVRLALAVRGVRVIEAVNGEDALAEVKQRPPDVIVLDLTMPVVDGREVLRRLGRKRTIPVLVVSADGAREVAHEFGAAWMDKPFDPDMLADKVLSLLPAPD